MIEIQELKKKNTARDWFGQLISSCPKLLSWGLMLDLKGLRHRMFIHYFPLLPKVFIHTQIRRAISFPNKESDTSTASMAKHSTLNLHTFLLIFGPLA